MESVQCQHEIRIQEGDKKICLERKSNILNSLFLIFIFLFLEIGKQMLNFTITTGHDDKMPIPTTVLVLLIEGMKLLMIVIYAQFTTSACMKVGFSIRFAFPAVCYFFSNLLYLHGITMTAPPIWMIMVQTRTLYTACLYKLALNKNVTYVQILGCLLIVSSIALTRISEFHSGKVTISMYLIVLSQLAAFLSSIACLYIEVLLKNDERTFTEQQTWLYTCGIVFGLISCISTNNMKDIYQSYETLQGEPLLNILLVLTIIITSCGGLCVPIIVKTLDSIVKDYLGAMNNILLAFFTAILFPDYFMISYIYALSLAVLISGILLYEKKSFHFLSTSSFLDQN